MILVKINKKIALDWILVERSTVMLFSVDSVFYTNLCQFRRLSPYTNKFRTSAMAAKELRLSQTRDQFFGLSSIYQVTMCPELLHKERNNVLSL